MRIRIWKLLLLECLLSGIFQISYSQQDTALVRVYGGDGIEKGVDLTKTPEGGLLILGNTGEYGSGSSDILLIKTDSNGILEWSKTHGSQALEFATSIQAVDDSSYIISGFTDRNEGTGYDGLLIQVNDSGETMWSKTYGSGEWDFFNDLAIGDEGEYIMAGNSYEEDDSDIWVAMTDSNGTLFKEKLLVDSGYGEAHSIVRTSDTSFAIAGEVSDSNGGKNMFQMELHENGDSIWWKVYGDTAQEVAYSIHKTTSGDRLITGSSTSFSNGDLDGWTLRTDSIGGLKWSTVFGGSEYYGHSTTKDDFGKSVIEGPDNKVIVNGETESYGLGGKGMYMVQKSANGYNEVSPTFGDTEDDHGESVLQLNSNRTAFLGSTKSYGSGQDDVYLVIVDTMVFNYALDLMTFKADPTFIDDSIKESNENPGIQVHPNPSSGIFHIDVEFPFKQYKDLEAVLINSYGKELEHVELSNGTVQLDATSYSDGVYFLVVYSSREGRIATRSIIKK